MGGYTALAIAGGIPHTDPEIEYGGRTDLISAAVDVCPDNRVAALVLLAPATIWYMKQGALKNVDLPILMLSAEKDMLTPYVHTQIVLDGITNQSQLQHRIVDNAGHYSFLAPFPDSINNLVGPAARDPVGFDRAKFQLELESDVLKFLNETIKYC